MEKFIGMFALVIWDARSRKLFAVRDRLGIKPLYYAVSSHGILLASELKPIIFSPGFDRAIDPLALQEYFARGYISSPRTIFQSAQSLQPGYYLEWNQDSNQVTVDQYWNSLDYFAADTQMRSDEEWIDTLEASLRSSVKYRLISDVPLGVFLSGGIDSSLIAALMCQVSSTPVKTFTIGFKESQYDEGSYAQKVADHLGTVHTPLQASYQDAHDLICHLPEYYDEPFADSSQIPTYLVSKLARRHVTVALSGDGGDELFCGYETYRLMDRWQHLWKFPRWIRSAVHRAAAIAPNERMRLAARGLALPDPLTFASYFNGLWRPQEIESLLPGLPRNSMENYAGATYLPSRTDRADVLEKLMLLDLQRYLPHDILTKVDRASMAVSLEARVPLLDHRVVELALKMPLSLKRRDGQSKFALRQILYRYVPRALVDRPKQGFAIPLDYWLKAELHDLLEKHLDPVVLKKQGLFNVEVVRFQVNRFMAGESGHTRVWSLLMFQMWAQRYLGSGV